MYKPEITNGNFSQNVLIHVPRCTHTPQKFHEVMSIRNMCTELWGFYMCTELWGFFFFFWFCVILSKVLLTHEIDIMTYQRGGMVIWAIQISSYLLIWQMRSHQAWQELEHSTLNSDREANTLSEPLHGFGRYQGSSNLSWVISLCSLFSSDLPEKHKREVGGIQQCFSLLISQQCYCV